MTARAHPIPDAALASHLAILGKTGAGKSYAARGTVERILARGERVCIVDPTGVWWGLRLGPDGRKPSRFPVVIAGGRRGDLPLGADNGAALAKIVGTTSTPMVLDTSAMSGSERAKAFTAFAETLLVENVGPLHLILDEAHLFAPQGRSPDPKSAFLLHATNNLVALGRARGLRITLLTQRPAKLHKDSLTQVETLVAMRLVAPQDRDAVEEWIGDQADKKVGAGIVASLPTLKQGEAWVWAPDQGVLERASFPHIVTFDSMSAADSGKGSKLPPIDIEKIRGMLATAAEEKPEPETSARKAPPRMAAAAEREQREYQRGYQDGQRAGVVMGFEQARRALSEFQRTMVCVVRDGLGDVSRHASPLSGAERTRKYREKQLHASRHKSVTRDGAKPPRKAGKKRSANHA